jgi:hypothetical protein
MAQQQIAKTFGADDEVSQVIVKWNKEIKNIETEKTDYSAIEPYFRMMSF